MLAAARLPVDVFPDLNRPTVTIMTEAEGLAPQEVEQLVTFVIETQMNGLPGVSRVRSVSGVGLSIVYVEFAWGTEIFRNRQQVAERLALIQGQLPTNVTAQIGPVNSTMGQILLIALTAPKDVSPMAVREVADFTIRPRLLTIPGVAQVIPMGGEVRQYRVAPNPPAMRAFGITYADLEKALAQFGGNSGGGFADQYAQVFESVFSNMSGFVKSPLAAKWFPFPNAGGGVPNFEVSFAPHHAAKGQEPFSMVTVADARKLLKR